MAPSALWSLPLQGPPVQPWGVSELVLEGLPQPLPSPSFLPSPHLGLLPQTRHSPGGQTRPSSTCGSPGVGRAEGGEGKEEARLQSPADAVPPLPRCPTTFWGVPGWLSEASGREAIRTRRWSSKMEVTVKLPGSPKPPSWLHARVHHRSPSLHQAPDRMRLAGWAPPVCGPGPREGAQDWGVVSGKRRSNGAPAVPWRAWRGGGGGGGGPHLEVRAVVVVPVHDLCLPAVPGQHRDHLPARQVRVELRGEDVNPRGGQGLQGEAGSGPGTWPPQPPAHGRPCTWAALALPPPQSGEALAVPAVAGQHQGDGPALTSPQGRRRRPRHSPDVTLTRFRRKAS